MEDRLEDRFEGIAFTWHPETFTWDPVTFTWQPPILIVFQSRAIVSEIFTEYFGASEAKLNVDFLECAVNNAKILV